MLYGGTSAEREISLRSGEAVIAALRRLGIEVVPVDVQPGVIAKLPERKLDCAVIMLHGPGGEDGALQGALEWLGVPYTGSGVLASALAMDKLRSKQLWAGIGLPTAEFVMLTAATDWFAALAQLGGKAMVKPVTEGSSIGMAIATSPEELEAAWREATQYGSGVMAERWLAGAEYTISVLNQRLLPVIKLETDRGFYDYQAKYLVDDTRYLCPCGLSAKAEEHLQILAKRAFDSLGCRGWGRVDVMADEQGNFYLLEVNTVPGMTDHSLTPKAAQAAGLTFDQLVLEILQGALESRG